MLLHGALGAILQFAQSIAGVAGPQYNRKSIVSKIFLTGRVFICKTF